MNSLMPGMPGSFGRFSGPLAMAMYCVVNASPRSVFTVHRWAASGLKGHKLRTVRVGGTLCTTEAWLWEFFEGLSAPEGVPVPRTPKQRQRDREKARRELEEAGI